MNAIKSINLKIKNKTKNRLKYKNLTKFKKVKQLAVIGDPIEHSLSPQIFEFLNQFYPEQFQYIKLRIEKEHLKCSLDLLSQLKVHGINITIPHKESIIPFLDQSSKEVKKMKACNLVLFKNGKKYGFNTDIKGVEFSLNEKNFNLKNKNVLLIGSGGAARATAFYLCQKKIKNLMILNRTLQHSETLVNDLKINFHKIEIDHQNIMKKIIKNYTFDLVIQSTSMGMNGIPFTPPNLEHHHFHHQTLFFEMVYRPLVTPFIKWSQCFGDRIIDGADMLIWQALYNFDLFFPSNQLSQKEKMKIKNKLKVKLKNKLNKN